MPNNALREKIDSDVCKKDFMNNWRLEKRGKSINDYGDKAILWEDLQRTKGQEILIPVKTEHGKLIVLPKENISKFKQWLHQEEGVTVLDNLREKLNSDISKTEFLERWHAEKNGQLVCYGEKGLIWNTLCDIDDLDILIKVKAGSQKTFVLPKENIPIFKRWLYKEYLITVPDNVRKILDTDITKKQFCQKWQLDKKGEIIDFSAQSKLWEDLAKIEKQTILIKARNVSSYVYVLPKENVSAFKQWLEEKGIAVKENEKVVRNKLKTDIIKSKFIQNWILEKGEKPIEDYYDKANLWDELQKTDKQNILINVQSGTHMVYALPQENIPLFKQWLNQKEIIVLDKKKKKIRDKLTSDILQGHFLKNWKLLKDGVILDCTAKSNIWNELKDIEGHNILVKVQSGSNQTPYVLPAENITLLKQWLSEKKGITVLNNLREKLYTDITKKDFYYTWRLIKDKKIIGDRKEKATPWEKLESLGGENILEPVLSGKSIIFVLPKENITLFKQWLHNKQGITVLNAREKLYTDTTYNQFCSCWQLTKDGKKVIEADKQALWKELQNTEKQTILIEVLSGPNVPYVLPEENIPLFKQWLKEEKGIIAADPFDKILELQDKAENSKTPTERHKYLTRAEKLFRRLNPDSTKQDIWSNYLEKISGKHK